MVKSWNSPSFSGIAIWAMIIAVISAIWIDADVMRAFVRRGFLRGIVAGNSSNIQNLDGCSTDFGTPQKVEQKLSDDPRFSNSVLKRVRKATLAVRYVHPGPNSEFTCNLEQWLLRKTVQQFQFAWRRGVGETAQ